MCIYMLFFGPSISDKFDYKFKLSKSRKCTNTLIKILQISVYIDNAVEKAR